MGLDVKPIIVISKCLGFEPCRYNGGMENNSFVEKLDEYVDFVKVCPEADSGLSIPRDTIRIIQIDDKLELIQKKTDTNLTNQIRGFSVDFLSKIEDVDGFILKSRSPSCGVKDAKIYPNVESNGASKKGKGFFTTEVVKRYPNAIIEDEGRLTNFKIREHFLTKIFLLANFRIAKKESSIEKLRSFHLQNSLLFLAYSQKYSKVLDSLIFSDENRSINDIFKEYESYLYKLLERAPRYTSNINVLLKTIDQFKENITDEEMQYIWNIIDKYKNGYVPFSVPLYLVKGYIIRFNMEHLLDQSFFMPYPEELIQVNDSGKLIH